MEEKKRSILIFVDWYEPGFKAGGPIRSISGFVNSLKNHFKIYLITRDRDLKGTEPYKTVAVNKWISSENNVSTLYLPPKNFISNIKKHTKNLKFNWVYTNSFFSFKFSILPYSLFCFKVLRADNFLIAPRGELKNAALAVKPIKKKFFLATINLLNLYKGNYWHATSKEEECNIITIHNNHKVLLASNLSNVRNNSNGLLVKKRNKLRVIFLSRIISYKNLEYAINILSDFKNIEGIILDVYGPIEDRKYFNSCIELAGISGVNLNYKGELEHFQVVDTFSKYHVFFFPTLGENFGHVIAEALIAGCPVLTTDQTPWSDLNLNNAGWTPSLDDNLKFSEAIEIIYSMDNEEFQNKRRDVLKYASKKINSKKTLDSYISFFNS